MKSMDMHLQKAWTPGPTCAGVCLLVVDLQEDQGEQQQQPAVGLVWGLLGQGSPAPRGRVKDPTKAPYPGRRRKPGGRRGRGAGAHCFHRHQGHRWRGTGGWWAGHGHDLLFLQFYSLFLSTLLSFSSVLGDEVRSADQSSEFFWSSLSHL